MVLLVNTLQNPQEVLSNFLSFFWDFGHIWMLLEIYGTFSGGSVNLLFFSEYKTSSIQCVNQIRRVGEDDNFSKYFYFLNCIIKIWKCIILRMRIFTGVEF